MARELFRFHAPATVARWTAIDDTVMGGVSASRFEYDRAGFAVFSGVVSLDRGGGFASVRSPPLDLADPEASAYVLEVCGDGKRYKINLRYQNAASAENYQAAFAPPAGIWSVVRLPLAGFLPKRRGQILSDAPVLDPARVCQAGLMIADRQAGPFSLGIRSICSE